MNKPFLYETTKGLKSDRDYVANNENKKTKELFYDSLEAQKKRTATDSYTKLQKDVEKLLKIECTIVRSNRKFNQSNDSQDTDKFSRNTKGTKEHGKVKRDENDLSTERKDLNAMFKQRSKTLSKKSTIKYSFNRNYEVIPSNTNTATRIKTISLNEITLKKAANVKDYETQDIYERSKVWLNERAKKTEESKKQDQKQEIEQCTFNPKLVKSKNIKENFNERNAKWILKRNAQLEKRQNEVISKELKACTFAPKTHYKPVMDVDPEDFYKRNMKWVEDVAEKTARKVPSVKRVYIVLIYRYYPILHQGRVGRIEMMWERGRSKFKRSNKSSMKYKEIENEFMQVTKRLKCIFACGIKQDNPRNIPRDKRWITITN